MRTMEILVTFIDDINDGVIEMVANGHPVCCIGKRGILASLQMKNLTEEAVLIQIVLAMNAIETTPTSVIVEILQRGNDWN